MAMNIKRDGRSFSRNKKKFLNKNQSLKLYKQKRNKIELHQKEIEELKKAYDQIDSKSVQTFDDFPLSHRTKKALKESNYIVPTEIQKDSIGLALNGHDILGAAKTGSGKTLAFVIPLLECLYCAGWSIFDGLGALIITPTRELAYQIFEVMNGVGHNHHFSVAMVTGGKDLSKEKKLLDKCNIVICTPGRLLHHMDQNPLFDAMNLKMLILDEADRILDLGFKTTVNAILENLPKDRQTLLFSATQTKSVKDLARLSLKNPVYVSVDEHAKHATPESLKQSYLVCEAEEKLNMLWSFIKSHKKQKILVFMTTCKQVKYAYESFCRLRPGVSVMALHGSMHQIRRMQIYDEFCKKNHVVMFATDIASRGLDFPNISWVVQLDCPEDTNTYIHRVGRTARYDKNGEALLVLLPSEKESMVEQLEKRKIPIEEIKVNPTKLFDIRRKLEVICARDSDLKDSAKRAFKTYLKSVFLMTDKTIFDVNKINVQNYAKSLGLTFAPRIRFLEKLKITQPPSWGAFTSNFHDSDSDELLLEVKSDPAVPPGLLNNDSDSDEPQKSKRLITKASIAKRILKKKVKVNTRTKFDEDGNPVREICGQIVPVVGSELQIQLLEEGYSIEKAKLLKEKEEEVDKLIFNERIKQKHRNKRLKGKEKIKNEVSTAPQLADADNEEASESDVDPNSLMPSSNSEDEEGNSMHNQSTSAHSDSEPSDESSNRKRKAEPSHPDVKRRKENSAIKTLHSVERSLDDDEQLALHFLSNS